MGRRRVGCKLGHPAGFLDLLQERDLAPAARAVVQMSLDALDERVLERPVDEPGQHRIDRAVLGIVQSEDLSAHSSNPRSSGSAIRSRLLAWNILVFTVLTGQSMICAISAQECPRK